MSNLLITSTDILEFFKPDDPAHVKCLQEVRDLIPAESSRNASDSDLARFLIARKFNVEDAVKLFTAHVVWRAANPYVTKADCLPSLACQTTYHHGFDREGHPLLVFEVAKHNPKTRDLDDTNRLFLFWMQHALAALPSDKTKFSVLIDRTGAGMGNQDIEFLKSLNAVWQDNFPERVFRIVVYPTGMVFYGLWNIVQFFLDPVTKEKVKPCYKASDVATYIDPQYLPASMSGTSSFSLPEIEDLPESPHVVKPTED